jgi:exosortase/archaeosortase
VLELLVAWLQQAGCAETYRLVPLERIAGVVSWAIFGTVLQWGQEITTVSSEELANTILMVIVNGVAHLVPEIALS